MNEYTYEVVTTATDESIKRTDVDGNVAYIPTDAANSDYQQYLVWLEAQTPKTTSKVAAN